MHPTSALHVVPLAMPEVAHGLSLPRGDDWVQWLREHGLYEGFIESLGGWMAAQARSLPRPPPPSDRLRQTEPMAWDGFKLHDVPHELHDHALMLIGSLEQPHASDWRPSSPPSFQLLPARWIERTEEAQPSDEPRRGADQPSRLGTGRQTPVASARPLPATTLGAPALSPALHPQRSKVGVEGTPTTPAILIMPPINGPGPKTNEPRGEEDPFRLWRVQRIARFEGREPRPRSQDNKPRKKRQR
jgi:hypothetical protein